jgi:hypothetical protein
VRRVLRATRPAGGGPRPTPDRQPLRAGHRRRGIASGRVPVGNAAGDPLTSWLNPTSLVIGALAVAIGGYLAAVYAFVMISLPVSGQHTYRLAGISP